jgi:antitoxin CptB
MLNEIEKKRKQLIFRAWHRGTREMDLIIGSFADCHVPYMPANDLDAFAALLEISDPELYKWYLDPNSVPQDEQNPLLSAYLQHKVAKRAADG